jgi:uncharacterized protein (DUF1015 family)
MSGIIPFNGILYNPAKVKDMSKVMAPPYDVISPAFQDELYGRHPQNIVRLELTKAEPSDTEANNKYTRAAADFSNWLEEDILRRDAKPAIYYYTQEYENSGKRLNRKGFIALKKLEEFGKGSVHPHEKTLSGPKADRLSLMKATNANLSCIFTIFSEADRKPDERVGKTLSDMTKGIKPDIEVADDDGVINRLWRIDDPTKIAAVIGAVDKRPLYIADGHHRYETAINYRNFINASGAKHGAHEYVMMYFASMDDEGMTIMPTHRVVHGLKNFNAEGFLSSIKSHFFVDDFFFDSSSREMVKARFLEKLAHSEEGRQDGNVSFGLCINGRDSFYLLTLKGRESMTAALGKAADAMPEAYKTLDVTVLHTLVLDKALGISQGAQEKQTNLKYVKGMKYAFDAGADPSNQMVFFMNPTRIEQVEAVAAAGLVMPQKSTYFYPKLLSGLVLNKLD